ncbi:MAG TPA: glutaredoxin 3 [Polyangia bacterium]|jgi:glutaredoxin 3|nr:glutaredoxin 3 [Polyangia bacterium]
MRSVVLYGRADCEYSAAARELLREQGIAFKEIDVDLEPQKMAEMLRRAAGRHTTPQIFIDGRHIGGYDDLRRLADRGGLDDAAGTSAP